ncbi:MAG: ZIP family metal transporter [Clostridia bacterium]|nr:ZIP family metal transporter [Clostridia bacterium]
MQLVIITALGVGMATVLGSFIGFALKKIPHKFNDITLSFAAGIMLAAAVLGLIIPAMESGEGAGNLLVVIAGILCGAVFLSLMDKVVPHLHHITGVDSESHTESKHLNRVMLFVMAIAIHNLPEGIAAGVSFGTGNVTDALTVAGGIALQNIPEGMVIISPMLNAGVKKSRAFAIALCTGLVEVIGTMLGYFVVNISVAILPFALSFAGGTMLYVISDEMIPETHSHGFEKGATYSLLIGFCVMLAMDFLLG